MMYLYGDFCILNQLGETVKDSSFEINAVILDSKDIDFSFNKLSNCYLTDAYRFLYSRKRKLQHYEDSYLVKHDNRHIFAKSDFWIQDISLKNNNKIHAKFSHGVILIETVIASFCKNIANIKDEDWWIYIAEHRTSGIRIVAGVGQCVAVSRCINAEQDIEEEISRTAMFLRRFGLKTPPAIITTIDGIRDTSFKIDLNTIHKRLQIEKCYSIETLLISYAKHIKARLVLVSDSYWEQIVDSKKLNSSLNIGIIIFGITLFWTLIATYHEQNRISALETESDITYNNLSLHVTQRNYDGIVDFLRLMQKATAPAQLLSKISKICESNNIKPSQLAIDGEQIKIKASLSKNEFEKLRANKSITLESASNSQAEFEDLLSDKKIETVLCIK